MNNVRIAVIIADDGLYSRNILKEIKNKHSDKLILIAKVDIPFVNNIRELVTIVMLYGFTGTLKAVQAKLFEKFESIFEKDTEVMRVRDPNDCKVINKIESHKINLILVLCPVKIGEKLLSIPKLGVWTRHGGTLPRFRGRYTPFWMWMENEKNACPAVIRVNEKFDAGDIFIQDSISLEHCSFPSSAMKRIMHGAGSQILALIDAATEEKVETRRQGGKARYVTVPKWSDIWSAVIKLILELIQFKC